MYCLVIGNCCSRVRDDGRQGSIIVEQEQAIFCMLILRSQDLLIQHPNHGICKREATGEMFEDDSKTDKVDPEGGNGNEKQANCKFQIRVLKQKAFLVRRNGSNHSSRSALCWSWSFGIFCMQFCWRNVHGRRDQCSVWRQTRKIHVDNSKRNLFDEIVDTWSFSLWKEATRGGLNTFRLWGSFCSGGAQQVLAALVTI